MRTCQPRPSWLALASILLSAVATAFAAAPPPTIEQILSLKPTQRFVEYDSPSPESLRTCKVEAVTEGRATGWVLRDATGRVYRKFMDTNRDNMVDQWRYYRAGIEVYRDIDSNFNGKPDQFRWVNSGGTRWAIDTNEDGKIDGYRVLSAEEASREVIRALALRDFSIVEPVLVRPADASTLGATVAPERIKEFNAKAKEQFEGLLSKLSHLTPESQWVRFEGAIPMLIPGDSLDGSRDAQAYRNASTMVQTGDQVDILQFGEMVLVGRVWKILGIPTVVALDGNSPVASSASFANVLSTAQSADPTLQSLIEQLQKLDESAAKFTGGESATASYHLQRAVILEKLASQSKSEQDRTEWQRQLADSLIAALQVESSQETHGRLNRLSESVRQNNQDSSLLSYIAFRHISADYSRKMLLSNSDFSAVQKEWLEQLDKFVADFPNAEDMPDALSQLAVGMEFTGKEDQAHQYYQKLADSFPKSPAAQRALGALRRLDLVGKPLVLKASDLRRGTVDIHRYQGKVVLVDYWSTKCDPCKADLPRLKQLYDKYHKKGFEIIGVSLDNDEKEKVGKFVQGEGIPWPVVYEGGGLESPLAEQYGIIALPTRFLVDAEGKVVSQNVQVSQLEDELKKLLK